MTPAIYVAKHVPDIRRWEPRNVGVVVIDSRGRVAARFDGEDSPDRLDLRHVSHRIQPSEVYREWVSYWRRMTARGAEGVEEAAESGRTTFFLMKAGEIWRDEAERTCEELLDEYYSALVVPDERPDEPPTLEDAVTEILTQTGVSRLPGFHTNYTVMPRVDGLVVAVKFQYAYQNGKLTVGQRIPYHSPYPAHAALSMFGSVAEEVQRSVAFVLGNPPEHLAGLIYLLRRQPGTTVVDVDDSSAAQRVADAFG
jgi:hypothetical protein